MMNLRISIQEKINFNASIMNKKEKIQYLKDNILNCSDRLKQHEAPNDSLNGTKPKVEESQEDKCRKIVQKFHLDIIEPLIVHAKKNTGWLDISYFKNILSKEEFEKSFPNESKSSNSFHIGYTQRILDYLECFKPQQSTIPSGGRIWEKCPVCDGTGFILSTDLYDPFRRKCDTCNGKGIISSLTGKPPQD